MVVRRGADLLGAAESWSEEEVEAGCQHLLDSIHSLLADEDTSLELRYRYPAQGCRCQAVLRTFILV